MVIAPLFADQPDNARCLAAAGLCVRVDDVDTPSLRAAILDALEDREMRQRAREAALDFAQIPDLEQALDRLVAG